MIKMRLHCNLFSVFLAMLLLRKYKNILDLMKILSRGGTASRSGQDDNFSVNYFLFINCHVTSGFASEQDLESQVFQVY